MGDQRLTAATTLATTAAAGSDCLPVVYPCTVTAATLVDALQHIQLDTMANEHLVHSGRRAREANILCNISR
jgi:hypothetical protein